VAAGTGPAAATEGGEMSSMFLGKGIYSVSFASRLTGIPSSSIKRWLLGYSRRANGTTQNYPPVLEDDLGLIEGRLFLSFLDLIEVQFLEAFLRHGVRWTTIREAASNARQLLGTSHPFSTKRFSTDGKRILVSSTEGIEDRKLMDLIDSQLEIVEMVEPLLRGTIEFSNYDLASRWWPLGREKQILIDPRYSFGRPVVSESRVPTDVLTATYKATESVEEVAEWYEIDVESVRQAIEYETIIAA
jgi:uncharacterized protein (DUF433 family)